MTTPRSRVLRVQLRARVRQGGGRVRRALVPVLVASAAAAVAWAVAVHVLGHTNPFFAPVSAWVALGFSVDRHPRRVAELATGVAVGVLLGDLLVGLIGTGAWQVGVVLALAALVARFLDRGVLLTTQAGVQAIVIVALPAAQAGSPLGRWVDALVGGGIALLVTALWPQDPRHRVRHLAEEGLEEVAHVLRDLGRGLLAVDDEAVEDALLRGRASQPALDQWRSVAADARASARVSPAHRRHRGELLDLEGAAVRADRAMRNVRVLARRCRPLLEGVHDLTDLGDLVSDVAHAAEDLAAAIGAGAAPTAARDRLHAIAERTDPRELAPDDWHVQGVVLLVRSVVVDLLETAGVAPGEARSHLPEL
ncbi:MAG: FUSC family protein [Actinotalea sp.]|nr:FUSC family protein [Actinotalea sp.]